ncbi:MAG: tryptophan 7-halogenase [Bacteroidetes bacterium]|nr:tryptophan 7-halogenase [Bacteroidota bacterium]
MDLKKQVDVLIIGAGPSGTVAAGILHKAGLGVQIVEKMRFPRFVIGESLLPRCMEALDEAGLLKAVEAHGFQQKTGAKFVWGDRVCDFKFSNQYTPGWQYAYQVTRADFDKTLADTCLEMGIPIHFETEVTGVTVREDGSSLTTVKKSDGSTEIIEARFIIDGSGYGRVLPTLFGLNRPSTQHTRRTLFAHMKDPFRQEADEPDRITIYVHDPKTWVWVIPFATGITSLGYVGSPDFFEKYSGNSAQQFKAMVYDEPKLKERFRHFEMIWEEPRLLQGWSATTEKFYGKGFVLTGNVTEFLDPVFSSGVTLATVSAQAAAHLVIRHLKGEQVDWQSEYMEYMQTGVDVFRTFVDAWYDGTLYKIFFADEREEDLLNKICSVLAGYVWDESNPFVKKSEKSVKALANYLSRNVVE